MTYVLALWDFFNFFLLIFKSDFHSENVPFIYFFCLHQKSFNWFLSPYGCPLPSVSMYHFASILQPSENNISHLFLVLCTQHREVQSDQISIIFDMKDTGWNNMDMDFVRYLITILKCYYPYFVNYVSCTKRLRKFWNIKPFCRDACTILWIHYSFQLVIFEMPWLLNGKYFFPLSLNIFSLF